MLVPGIHAKIVKNAHYFEKILCFSKFNGCIKKVVIKCTCRVSFSTTFSVENSIILNFCARILPKSGQNIDYFEKYWGFRNCEGCPRTFFFSTKQNNSPFLKISFFANFLPGFYMKVENNLIFLNNRRFENVRVVLECAHQAQLFRF